MAAAQSDGDIFSSTSIGQLPQTSADCKGKPPTSIMNQLSHVLAGTTLHEPEVPAENLQALPGEQQKEESKKPSLHDATSTERSTEKRVGRLAKRRARKAKKQQKRQEKLTNSLISDSSNQQQHQERRFPDRKNHISRFPRHSLLSEMVRGHATTQGRNDGLLNEGEKRFLRTASFSNLQDASDGRIECTMQVSQMSQAYPSLRKSRSIPVGMRTAQEHLPRWSVHNTTDMDTIMQ